MDNYSKMRPELARMWYKETFTAWRKEFPSYENLWKVAKRSFFR